MQTQQSIFSVVMYMYIINYSMQWILVCCLQVATEERTHVWWSICKLILTSLLALEHLEEWKAYVQKKGPAACQGPGPARGQSGQLSRVDDSLPHLLSVDVTIWLPCTETAVARQSESKLLGSDTKQGGIRDDVDLPDELGRTLCPSEAPIEEGKSERD